jgi:formylglycine-generating enzyme required for sulfatase activity
MTRTHGITNPYIAGNPITGEQMFFGRQDVFKAIRRNLIGEYQDHVIVLYGQRRTGKTSVLYQMHRHLPETYIPILVDLQGMSLEGMGSFLWELINIISRSLRRSHDIRLPRLDRKAFLTDPREQFVETLLTDMQEAIGHRRLLLMFDEAVLLENKVSNGQLEPDVFRYLSSLMQHYQLLTFVFCIGSRVEQMRLAFSSLFRVALYQEISFLDRESAIELITEPVKGVYEYEPAAVERILSITSGHPYYTQLLCHSIFARWQVRSDGIITVADVDAVLPEAVERSAANLQYTWENASDEGKAILAALAEAAGERGEAIPRRKLDHTLARCGFDVPPGKVTGALKTLWQQEVVTAREPYSFTVDLLRLWLRKHKPMDWVCQEISTAIASWHKKESSTRASVRRWRQRLSFGLMGALILILLGWVAILQMRTRELGQALDGIILTNAASRQIVADRLTPAATAATASPTSAPSTPAITPTRISEYTLADYPRPPDDNGHGLHLWTNLYRSASTEDINELRQMGLTWVVIVDDGSGNQIESCRLLLENGITPIVRLYRPTPNPGQLSTAYLETVSRYVDIGVRYFLTNNEPDLESEWEEGYRPLPDNWMEIVVDNFIADADAIIERGGLPGFPPFALHPLTGSPAAQMNPYLLIKEKGREDLFKKGMWIAVHNYFFNRVYRDDVGVWHLEYPEDPINAITQQAARTVAEDPLCWRAFEYYNQLVVEAAGQSLPIIVTEGGPAIGRADPRYPELTAESYGDAMVALFEYMEDEAPDYYFAFCPWNIEDWYPDGVPQPVVGKVKAMMGYVPTPTSTPTQTSTPMPTSTPTSTPTPAPGATRVWEQDGSEMVYVPPGEFTMGSETGDADEQPVHNVWLSGFWIDRYEVTNAQYQRCVDAGSCKRPAPGKSETRERYFGDPTYNDYPVLFVDSTDAEAYCLWLGKRLPTEAEWEKAASWDWRTETKFTWPWGNTFDDSMVRDGDPGDTVSVGSHPKGASPYGVMDMAGNVLEWTADWYAADYYASSPESNPKGPSEGYGRVVRGGTWWDVDYDLRTTRRKQEPVNAREMYLGFRCVADEAPCTLSPAAIFTANYTRASACLGCAIAEAAKIALGEQAFEHGRMFWQEDEGVIYALFEDGTWLRFPDTYSDDQPPDDPTLVPPSGLLQPVHGLGKVWREQLGGPDSTIGWAQGKEQSYRGWRQPFRDGLMLIGGDGTGYVLCDDGTWR